MFRILFFNLVTVKIVPRANLHLCYLLVFVIQTDIFVFFNSRLQFAVSMPLFSFVFHLDAQHVDKFEVDLFVQIFFDLNSHFKYSVYDLFNFNKVPNFLIELEQHIVLQ